MSWSKSFASKAEFADRAAARASVETQNGADALLQFDVAVAAAASIIGSGVVGDETRDFSISLSGHANPHYAPAHGWANDAVSISIYQKS